MVDKIVWQRCGFRGQEDQRDPLECRAVRAGRDVGGRAGRAAVAENPDRADRLHVPRRRGDPRNPVGDGRRRLGKRRARGGGRAAENRRAEGYRAGSARAGGKTPSPRRPCQNRDAGSAYKLMSSLTSVRAPGSTDQLTGPKPKALISWSSG